MTNHPKILGDCYKKFGLEHTSKSTACLKHSDRFFKKVLFPKETKNLNNASFQGGTIIHKVVQKVVTSKLSLDEVINSDEIQKDIDAYYPFNDKDKYKFKFIIKNLRATAENHLKNLEELEPQKFKTELEYTAWLPNVDTYWLMYLDLVGEKNFGDLKNCFGSVKLSPLKNPDKPIKKKDGKPIDNRIDDWTYTNVKVPTRPYYSDVMQIALYKNSCQLPPFLSYASNTDRKLFTENNCDELKQENLDQSLKVLLVYEKAWQKKLEIADGDIEKLAWLCVPDVSDIKKNTFMWENVPEEYKQKFLDIYEL
tara:strand:+ start:938 stop:1867 length:930 start_codon:yes stop_codon:yes gene_type:complete